MKKSLAVTLVALFVLAVSFAMVPKKANAIPAFAEKYHFSCAVCHTVFPNLNPFGRAFWRNGFRLPGTNGTPADATQIANGLSLPNPWPIPIVLEAQVFYQHLTNENTNLKIGGIKSNGQTDMFNYKTNLVIGGATKLYTPFANSLSFYANYGENGGGGTIGANQVWASLDGIGSGFGLPSHLVNLKLGNITTASPYFYRQNPFSGGFIEGPVMNGQNLTVGYDGEGGALIHAQNEGIALYGTPGYHLWYKVTVTNDAGNGNSISSPANNNYGEASTSSKATSSNAMEYSYQLKEYLPTSAGQLEFGYYGASIAEPLTADNLLTGTQNTWTDGIQVNGVDVDLANDVYELGLTYMEQHDSNPYNDYFNGTSYHNTNGYNTFEVYGRYLFPTLLGHGAMLVADFSTYSWQHKQTEEAFNNSGTLPTSCANQNLYESGTYASGSCNTNEGIKDAFDIFGDLNLAYNAHLYAGYIFTNKSQDDMFRTGLYFAF
ncbi:MAG: hypothetical protein EVJ48_08605 [Candidatus Acidulodesulfobacterium acidiphilum]|uniref:Cytochrome C n=1 Tax=Candidatus Acidulodesulfobacterium acidiphilum TaxID=2597224 RepID=A0A520X8T6_9DELT|nr:MAG: hypothetical protein EVJ48_08605 [Candidatus Acidulodesulfobacterium acidiphilum]